MSCCVLGCPAASTLSGCLESVGSERGQRSMTAMLPSSWRSSAAGRALVTARTGRQLISIPSAAVFSSTRATRLVPGDRGHVVAAGQQPGQSDLCRCGAGLGGEPRSARLRGLDRAPSSRCLMIAADRMIRRVPGWTASNRHDAARPGCPGPRRVLIAKALRAARWMLRVGTCVTGGSAIGNFQLRAAEASLRAESGRWIAYRCEWQSASCWSCAGASVVWPIRRYRRCGSVGSPVSRDPAG